MTTKKALNFNSSLTVTGISQLFGGAVLLTVALYMGGRLPVINYKSILVFCYICVVSMIAYCIWNHLICKMSLSKLYIIKFTEPVFACLFSALLLDENIFKWQYLLALILVSVGIWLEFRDADKSK